MANYLFVPSPRHHRIACNKWSDARRIRSRQQPAGERALALQWRNRCLLPHGVIRLPSLSLPAH